MFIIDTSSLPKGNEPPFLQELENPLYITIAANVHNGFYPAAGTTYSMEYERKAFGLGTEDHRWNKEEA